MLKRCASILLALVAAAPVAAQPFPEALRDFVEVRDSRTEPQEGDGCDSTQERVVWAWRTKNVYTCEPDTNTWSVVDSANSKCARGICYADRLSNGGTGTYADPFVGFCDEFFAGFAADYGHLHFPQVGNGITYYNDSCEFTSTETPGNFVLSGAGKDKAVMLNTGDGSTAANRALTVDLTGVDTADRQSQFSLYHVGFEQKQTALASGGSVVRIDDALRFDLSNVSVNAPTGHCSAPDQDTVCREDADCPGTCTLTDLTSSGIAFDLNGPVNFGAVYQLNVHGKDDTGLFGTGFRVFDNPGGNVGPLNVQSFYCNRCTVGVEIGKNASGPILNNIDFYDWKIVPNGGGDPVANTTCFDVYGAVKGLRIETGLCEGSGDGIILNESIDGAVIHNNSFAGVRANGTSSKMIYVKTTGTFKRIEGLQITNNAVWGYESRCTGDDTVECNTGADAECTTGLCSTTTDRACDADADCPFGETCNTGATPAGGTCEVYDEGQVCIYIDAWQLQSAEIYGNYVTPQDGIIHPLAGCRTSASPLDDSLIDPQIEDDTPGESRCSEDNDVVCTSHAQCQTGVCSTTTTQACTVDGDCPGVETCTGTAVGGYCIYNRWQYRWQDIRIDSKASYDNNRNVTSFWNNIAIGDSAQFSNPTVWFNAIDQQNGDRGKLEYDVLNHTAPRFEFNKRVYSSSEIRAFESLYSTNGGIFAGDATLLDVELNSLRLYRGNPHNLTLDASGCIDANATLSVCRGAQTQTCSNDYDCAHCSTTTTTWCEEDNDCPTGTCSVTTTTSCHEDADCPGVETCVGGETCTDASKGVCDTVKPLVKHLAANSGTSDTLECINNGSNGDLLILSVQAGGYDIVIQDGGNGGDVALYGGLTQDCTIDNQGEYIVLMRTSANSWQHLGGSGCDYRETYTIPIVLFRDTGLKTTDDVGDVWKAHQDIIITGASCTSDDTTATVNVKRDRSGTTTDLFSSGTCTCNGACTINTVNEVLLDGDYLDYFTLAPGTANRISVMLEYIRRDVN